MLPLFKLSPTQQRAWLLDGGRTLTATRSDAGTVIQLPGDPTDEHVSVVAVEVAGE